MDEASRCTRREAADWLILRREEPDDETVHRRFEIWLDADPANVRAWADITGIFKTLGEVPASYRDGWGGGKRTASWRRLRGRRTARTGRSHAGTMVAGAAAAALAVVAAPSLVLHIEADAMTGRGGLRTVRLDDGSIVRLGPESAIAVAEGSGGRTVRLLAGRAWFEVKHDPTNPFRVVAGDVTTTDIGTTFDVRTAYGITGVAVASGRVRVARAGVTRELGGGQWLQLSQDGIRGGGEAPGLVGAWRNGSVVIRNRSIAEAIDELRPWYGGRIILADAAFGRQRIDGVYDGRDPQAALTALVAARGGRVTRLTPWLMIVHGK